MTRFKKIAENKKNIFFDGFHRIDKIFYVLSYNGLQDRN